MRHATSSSETCLATSALTARTGRPRPFSRWLYPISKRRAKFSASHATLDPDRACSASQDGTLSLSKAAIRLTQTMKAGHTFLLRPLRHLQFKCAGHHHDRVSVGKETSTPLTTTIDDRSAPSYDRTATLDRNAQNLSLWRGSGALKPQVPEPPATQLLYSLAAEITPRLSASVEQSSRGPVQHLGDAADHKSTSGLTDTGDRNVSVVRRVEYLAGDLCPPTRSFRIASASTPH